MDYLGNGIRLHGIDKIFSEEYGVCYISVLRTEVHKHRGKRVKHIPHLINFLNGSELTVFVPHYFEKVGLKRVLIKELDKDRILKRNKKIKQIKERIL